jgi:hypothetical protein
MFPLVALHLIANLYKPPFAIWIDPAVTWIAFRQWLAG